MCWWCLVTKSCLTLAIPWTIAHQAPLSMEFTRQEYWSSLVINFEIRDFQLCYSSRFLALQGLLRFNMNFKMDFSNSAKKVFGILTGIILNLKIPLGSIDILTILSLLTHEEGFPGGSVIKNPSASARDAGSIPGL